MNMSTGDGGRRGDAGDMDVKCLVKIGEDKVRYVTRVHEQVPLTHDRLNTLRVSFAVQHVGASKKY